ncbi:MAG: iron-containing alcohol dehydrogenase [Candidatus Helarchaeota archaeon]
MIKRNIMIPHLYHVNELYIGKGAFSALKYIEEEKFLIFVSKTVKNLENYKKIEKYCEGKTYIEEIIESGNEKTILECRNKYQDYNPDVLVAVGGGKVIDTAKIVKFLIENPKHNLESLKKEYYNFNKKIQLVAVPTTPSTGSEANYTAVMNNKQNEKVPYVNRSFIPDMAILDMNFLETIPIDLLKQMTADIFGHSFESYFSKLSKPLLKAYSRLSLDFLKKGYEELKDDKKLTKAFENIMISGFLGGVAAGNAFVGVCHALAHAAEIMIKKGHNTLIMNLIKPVLTWHQKETKNPDYEDFLKDYELFSYDKYLTAGIFDGLDNEWWASAALKDASIKTNPVRMKLTSMLELIDWIKTN